MITYLISALVVSVFINLVMFLIAFKYKTDKLTDASYSLSFIVLALFGLSQATTPGLYDYVLTAMVCVWALRLGGFLMIRIWKTGKDRRFDEMRDSFLKFGQFWALQAVAVWVILIPALLALRYLDSTLTLLPVLAVVAWAVGVAVEATADWQKYRFSQNPNNKGMWIAEGVWNYSRHPNYFGEILVWVSVYVYTLHILTSQDALIALISPIFISGLLLFVSGIPILEKSADERWGKDTKYQAYKRRTSLLIPLPHRN